MAASYCSWLNWPQYTQSQPDLCGISDRYHSWIPSQLLYISTSTPLWGPGVSSRSFPWHIGVESALGILSKALILPKDWQEGRRAPSNYVLFRVDLFRHSWTRTQVPADTFLHLTIMFPVCFSRHVDVCQVWYKHYISSSWQKWLIFPGTFPFKNWPTLVRYIG